MGTSALALPRACASRSFFSEVMPRFPSAEGHDQDGAAESLGDRVDLEMVHARKFTTPADG